MINIFFILYVLGLGVVLFGVFAVLYHLWAYQLNLKISLFATTLFVGVVVALLASNIYFATQVDWNQLNQFFFPAGSPF